MSDGWTGQAGLSDQLADQIEHYLHDAAVPSGNHISAQALADRFHVSRFPIQKALKILTEKGVVTHEPRRGYFVAEPGAHGTATDETATADPLSEIYFRIGEDRLSGKLPQSVSEKLMRERYDLSQANLKSLLNRMLSEGWIERRQGYGWRFHDMLTTPDALVQTYRMRAALEPAALLEPTFHIDMRTLARLGETEQRLLDGEIETASSDALYSRGVVFHETLARASGNPYIFDALQRVNRIRRLLAYRSMINRERYYKQAAEHLEIVNLISRGLNAEASVAMRHHLGTVMTNLIQLEPILRHDK
ncbi:GntR family transcriptional regulator [Zhengella mangrovi]|uniref:GntR family transcriptional regulator n=1 Tax=Zhengella mangrovi TaxID=1982044 RepID=A0A2G1QK32_9HYPH|nr:GntR family transcriptional regulator [Zhengella mangrovi]PHP65810.1 GntR family transcriptional regulator [Zhengella mangrovi]